MTGTATVNPKSAQHRVLRFNSLNEMVAEADRLVAAERTGSLKHTGNWSLGQTLGHLAYWINVSFDGYPPEMQKPPWIIRLIVKPMRRRFTDKQMPRGVRMGKVPGGTFGIEPLSTEEGLARLRKAAERLKSAAPSQPNPCFGVMTHDEWIGMNLRHAELHMGYFHV